MCPVGRTPAVQTPCKAGPAARIMLQMLPSLPYGVLSPLPKAPTMPAW